MASALFRAARLARSSASLVASAATRAANSGASGAAGSRCFATAAETKSGSSIGVVGALGLLGGVGGLYYAKTNGYFDGLLGAPPKASSPQKQPFKPDYNAVKAAIADVLDAPEGYDDGSYGPIFVRLAWHASGTYDKESGTGGSNGATMRFDPESGHPANAGLRVARDVLEPVKQKFPWISYSDLWTLAGVTAIEEMGGPAIPWRPGRTDKVSGEHCTPDGRLPDASKGAPHIRDVFYRMGFNDQEIVALSGAHALGRCHPDRSGFVNPWTNAPTTFSNLYFTELVDNKWKKKKWDGPLQYEDPTGTLMMLPTDMALIWDKKFKPYVQQYAKDQDKFFEDFSAAFCKLLELGVPFGDPHPAPASPHPRA